MSHLELQLPRSRHSNPRLQSLSSLRQRPLVRPAAEPPKKRLSTYGNQIPSAEPYTQVLMRAIGGMRAIAVGRMPILRFERRRNQRLEGFHQCIFVLAAHQD